MLNASSDPPIRKRAKTVHIHTHNLIQKFDRDVCFFFTSFLMTSSENDSGNVARAKPVVLRQATKALVSLDVLGSRGSHKIMNGIGDREAKGWPHLWNKSDAAGIGFSAASILNVLGAPELEKGLVDVGEKTCTWTTPDAKELPLAADWKSLARAFLPDGEALNSLVRP
jgi:hypothetical protein